MDLFGNTTEAAENAQKDAEEDIADVVQNPADDRDGEEGLLPPRAHISYYGHDHVSAHLRNLFDKGTLPHGIIFSGPHGVGKATLAFRFARFLLDKGAQDNASPHMDALFDAPPKPENDTPQNDGDVLYIPPDSKTFRQVASGAHPDLFYISLETGEEQRKSLDVVQVRQLSRFLRHKATYDGGWRVAIIDDADTMTLQAQNALLKNLEEPPPQCLIILVAHRIGALIPTIRSRTQNMVFRSLSREDFSAIMTHHDTAMNEDELSVLYDFSEGSVSAAQTFLDSNAMTLWQDIFSLLNQYPNWPDSAIHALAHRTGGRDPAMFDNLQDVLLKILRLSLHVRAEGKGAASGSALPEDFVREFCARYTLSEMNRIHDQIAGIFDDVASHNLEKRQAVLRSFTLLKT